MIRYYQIELREVHVKKVLLNRRDDLKAGEIFKDIISDNETVFTFTNTADGAKLQRVIIEELQRRESIV